MELSIFHDGQFFIGLVEYREEDKIKFVKFTFGTEPNSVDIFNFIHNRLDELMNQTKVSVIKKKPKKVNPKRLQRQIAKEQKQTKYSTYAQQAIKKEQEIKKLERKKKNKLQKEKTKAHKRQLKMQKTKQKKKGH
ncbi:YjdF family protein [Staphylococcus sp. Marseille-Q1834]|uniref:YjdF family protein n=1 Tax=Staphylococcus sp. Marseille-Q1834 TaxID=2866594 RepID=UPI0012B8E311|nr:YjdF family protein [Staphylococcus sp. Marseille-Q1834]